ncbi:MAG: hypothetical protein OEZ14_02215 [Acidimicrobiia bacterium]|nr:hypothetical protein [Acidimicrobiia bacterium]
MEDRIDANSPVFSSVDPGATELPLELGDGLSRSREVVGVGGFGHGQIPHLVQVHSPVSISPDGSL